MHKTLDLKNVPLTGRSAELHLLQDAFDSLSSDISSKNRVTTVYIEAISGAGKSFLVESWYQQQLQPSSTILVSGKFDQHRESNEPYAGIVQAIDQLCSAVDTGAFRHAVRHNSTSNIEVLVDLIPHLRKIFEEKVHHSNHGYTDDDSSSTITDTEDDDSQELSEDFTHYSTQFKHAIQSMLRLASDFIKKPLVMLIDDIQWADENSLDLLETLLPTFNAGGVLLVLAARPVEEDWPFLLKIEDSLEACGHHLQKIPLAGLSVKNMNVIISTVLESSLPSTFQLTEILFAKTKGNPYFVLQYISLLQRCKLIQYSTTENFWYWNESTIRNRRNLPDKVEDVVLDCVNDQHPDTQNTLHLASYLGSLFEADDLCYLTRGMKLVQGVQPLSDQHIIVDIDTSHRKAIENALQLAIGANLVDSRREGKFRFSNDTIQRSLLDVPVDGTFLFRVGFVIRNMFHSSRGKPWMQFAATQILNEAMACITDNSSRLILVKLNLQASQTAVTNAAFFPASKYLEHGVVCAKLLHEPWQENYKMMIQLYTQAALVECACGRHQRVNDLSNEFLEMGLEVEDSVDAYFWIAASLQAQARPEEAFQILLDGLRHLGETFPSRPGSISLMLSGRETRRLVSRKSDADIFSMTVISEKKANKKMKFLGTAFLVSYLGLSEQWMVLMARRMIIRTLQLGLSKYTPMAFAAYAKMLAKAGDFDQASRFGRISNQLINHLRVKENLAVTTFFLAAYVEHLQRPMYQSLLTLNRAIEIGFELGDSQGAFICASTALAFKNAIGSPLSDLMRDSSGLFHHAKEYNEENLIPEFLLMWQYTANLQGKTSDPLVFDGVLMKEQDTMNDIVHSRGQMTHYYRFLKIMACCYMGDWHQAKELVDKMHETVVGFVGLLATHYSLPLMYTFAGVTWFKIYARTKDRSVLLKARFAIKLLKRWVSKGALNVATSLWFVEAQRAAVDQDFDTVKILFDKTILGLHRCGFRSLEALACENFAIFASSQGDEEQATIYMQQAHRLYTEFEALAKVEQLESHHSSLIEGNALQSLVLPANDIQKFEEKLDKAATRGRRSSWWTNAESKESFE